MASDRKKQALEDIFKGLGEKGVLSEMDVKRINRGGTSKKFKSLGESGSLTDEDIKRARKK